ncbi:MAG: PIN domain-containing protein [Kiritimatiellae bacterium]|nr:PIN domain-containing protein [Kiritimatiellia bacterium]
MASVARAFVDTSALFAAVLSPTGGARMVLKLGEADAVKLLASRQVLSEADGALRRKALDALPDLGLLLERAGLEIVSSAPHRDAVKLLPAVGHPGDAQIAADARAANADYLVTLDKAHLLGNRRLARAVPYVIGSPGDFLAWFRSRL